MARATKDVRKELINKIGNVYPITSNKVGDAPGVSTICSAVMTTYQATYMMAKTATGPARALQDKIVNGINNISNETLKGISNELNKLVADVPKVVLPETMDPAAAGMTSLFKSNCTSFSSFLPTGFNVATESIIETSKEYIANKFDLDTSDESFFSKAKMSIVDMVKESEIAIKDFMTLPMDMYNSIAKQTKAYKDAAVDELFGTSSSVSQSIREYEEMMSDLGIPAAIKTLQKIEKCLMNPKMCGKKKKDLIAGGPEGTKDLLSVELSKVFNIDANGRLRLQKILPSSSKVKTVMNIKRKMVAFDS